MSDSTPVLKFCPHCDGEAERYSIESDHGRKHYVWCGADDDAWCGTTTRNFSTPLEADVAWNRRTVDRDALVELLDELNKYLPGGDCFSAFAFGADAEIQRIHSRLAAALGLDP